MRKIGLIVNPVAGMGGAVGLKGTDGEMYEKALELGAEPVTPERVREFLSRIGKSEEIEFLVAPGQMGEEYIGDFDFSTETVGEISKRPSKEDTKRIAKEMLNSGIEILAFVGGDGTARDIYDAVGASVPVIPVPAGVKVFGSVFAVNPRAAAGMLDSFLEEGSLTEREVLDIDEDSFREGRLSAERYGYLEVPETGSLLQEGKESSTIGESSAENKRRIAKHIIGNMERNTLYFLGPGTTLRAVANKLQLDKTLLGVDAVLNQELIGSDLNEDDMLNFLGDYKKAEILVTPVGGNGFIFGRGNKQFTPDVIRGVGAENVTVVGDRSKISGLRNLRVDTGDRELDEKIEGSIEVVTGYKERIVMEVVS